VDEALYITRSYRSPVESQRFDSEGRSKPRSVRQTSLAAQPRLFFTVMTGLGKLLDASLTTWRRILAPMSIWPFLLVRRAVDEMVGLSR
jgi:hypothetical protein